MINELVPGQVCPGALEFGFQEVFKQAVGFQRVSHGAPVVFRTFHRMTDQIELPEGGSEEGRCPTAPGFLGFQVVGKEGRFPSASGFQVFPDGSGFQVFPG